MIASSVLGGATVALTFAAYLMGLLAVGFWASRKTSADMDGFFLGGRGLGSFVVALSAVVSGRSSWLILGVSGAAFVKGVAAVWVLPGYVLAELFMFVFVAPRLRRYTARKDCLTVPDYFEARFHDGSRILRVLSVAMIIVFFTAYIGAQLTAGTKTFQAGFGLGAFDGTVLITVIVGIYTVIGGFLAVSVNDCIQACLILLGLVLMPAAGLWKLGGLGALLGSLAQIGPPSGALLAWGASTAILGGLAVGLGSFGQPHILARYMSIDDPERLRMAALVGTIWNVLLGWGSVFVGLVGRVVYREVAVLPLGDKETLFIRMAADSFPPVLVGLLIACVVAAILSTVDSQLLVAASGAARDVYNKLTVDGRKATPRELVWVSRFFVLLILAAAFILGIYARQTSNQVFKDVFSFVLQAWYGLGCAFGPLLLTSLYWSGCSRDGAVAGMVAGPCFVFLGLLTKGFATLIGAEWAAWFRPEVVGFVASFLAIVTVSKLRPPADDVRREIDAMGRKA